MVAPASDWVCFSNSSVVMPVTPLRSAFVRSASHYSRTFKLNMNGYGEKGVEGGIWPKMLTMLAGTLTEIR
jgi:hypothetical protein